MNPADVKYACNVIFVVIFLMAATKGKLLALWWI